MASMTPELYELIIKIVDMRVKELKVTREEFDALRRSVEEGFKKLTEAQRRTEERLEELAKAQARTEEGLERLEAVVEALAKRLDELVAAQHRTEERLEQLARAQAETEDRLGRLEAVVEQLAKAQARTERRLEQLAQAQASTEARLERLARRVEELAAAQARTEAVVEKLANAVDALRVEVGRLAETVGFSLEDIARTVLPGWLYRHLGIEVERLERRFIEIEGREVEVNLYGEGVRRGRRVVVIGEVKSRIYASEVRAFYERVYEPLASRMQAAGVEAVGLLFGYLVHPSARELARRLGLHVVAAYGSSA